MARYIESQAEAQVPVLHILIKLYNVYLRVYLRLKGICKPSVCNKCFIADFIKVYKCNKCSMGLHA